MSFLTRRTGMVVIFGVITLVLGAIVWRWMEQRQDDKWEQLIVTVDHCVDEYVVVMRNSAKMPGEVIVSQKNDREPKQYARTLHVSRALQTDSRPSGDDLLVDIFVSMSKPRLSIGKKTWVNIYANDSSETKQLVTLLKDIFDKSDAVVSVQYLSVPVDVRSAR